MNLRNVGCRRGLWRRRGQSWRLTRGRRDRLLTLGSPIAFPSWLWRRLLSWHRWSGSRLRRGRLGGASLRDGARPPLIGLRPTSFSRGRLQLLRARLDIGVLTRRSSRRRRRLLLLRRPSLGRSRRRDCGPLSRRRARSSSWLVVGRLSFGGHGGESDTDSDTAACRAVES